MSMALPRASLKVSLTESQSDAQTRFAEAQEVGSSLACGGSRPLPLGARGATVGGEGSGPHAWGCVS